MSEFTMNLRNIENMKNDRERIEVSNFYVTNYLRENDCCISLEDWKTILFYDYDPWCLIYEVVEHWTPEKERRIAKIWWSEFEKVNTNDYGQITEPFMFWSKGTDQFDIMDAFKDFFDIDVIEDKDFMGMIGFANGDYLVNAFKRKREENKMKSTNNRDLTPDMCNDETDHPMVSCGEYLNFWTTEGDYDVYIIFHECEEDKHDEVVETVVHQIMDNRNDTDTKEELAKRITTALEALVEWEYRTPYVIVDRMKKERSEIIMNEEKIYNLGEVIFDMTLAVRFMMPEDADIDSREIYSNIFEWANEFEKEHSCNGNDADYYTAVDKFTVEKVSETYGEWFD